MRRIATVVSSVPDASSAASITSRLGARPVPMISRDTELPAGYDQLIGISDRRVVPRHQPPCTAVTISTLAPSFSSVLGVLAPRDHLAVHGNGNAAWGCGTVRQVEHVAQPYRRYDLARLPVNVDDHRVRPLANAKRSRVKGAAMLSSSPVMIRFEMTSAVSGVSSTPLR